MDIQDMLFQNGSGIVRTVLVGSLAYATLVLFLRISGKRTLAKLNAFDLVAGLDALSHHPAGIHRIGRGAHCAGFAADFRALGHQVTTSAFAGETRYRVEK